MVAIGVGLAIIVRNFEHAHVAQRVAALTKLDGRRLHAPRSNIKKLRYAVDSFATPFDREVVRAIMGTFSRLQNILGAMNDLDVAEGQVAAALAQRLWA